jgi:hypothetical protein
MGIIAIPFDTVPKAKRFKRRMSKPWIAKVSKEKDEDYYIWNHPDRDLVGGDNLWDWFDSTADKKKKDFDIRPFVKEEVRAWLDVSDPTSLGEPLEAINIVRETVGLKKFDPNKKVSITEPIKFLKANGFPLKGYEAYKISEAPRHWMSMFNLKRFARMKDIYVYDIGFVSDRLDTVKSTLKERFDVVSVTKPFTHWKRSRIVVIRMKGS